MRGADVYYGAVAEGYDASRENKTKWKIEQAAVAEFLTEGPVLDVPFGTGRFVPVYRDKGLEFTGIDVSQDMLAVARRKYPGVNAQLGSVFDLPFTDGAFATAVCVRLLEWLPLDRAAVALRDLQRIAQALIVTIVHGVEGEPEAFTYDFGKFLRVIDGLLIERRQVTAQVRGMISEVVKLRPASWSDVVDQFRFDHPDDAELNIQRLADKYAGFVGLHSIAVRAGTVTVRAEYWSGDRIGGVVQDLRGHRFVVDSKPRDGGRPVTILQRNERNLMIDGRRRANLWMNNAGPHPTLVLRPK